jgi:hypothetical protein
MERPKTLHGVGRYAATFDCYLDDPDDPHCIILTAFVAGWRVAHYLTPEESLQVAALLTEQARLATELESPNGPGVPF